MADESDSKAEVETATGDRVSKGPKPGSRQIGSAELPRRALEECVSVAKPIHEIYAGRSASWDELASALGMGAKSNSTKYLIWAAQAYDLLVKEGDNFALSETARKLLAPNYPEESFEARLKAITVPTVLSRFYTDYNGKLLPDEEYFENVLENRYSVPRSRACEAKEIILANAKYAGIITTHSNGKQTIRLDNAPSKGDAPLVESKPSIVSAGPAGKDESGLPSEGESVCFYITPIGEEGTEVRKHADMLLRHIVEPAFEQFNIRVVRADKIEKSGLISQQIFEYIISSQFCVADLSFGNPNAFYELGIRHMTRLPTIQMIRKGDKIPFDVSQGRTIIVDVSDIYTVLDKVESARKELIEHIRNYLEPGDKGRADDNPVSIYLPGLQVRLPKVTE